MGDIQGGPDTTMGHHGSGIVVSLEGEVRGIARTVGRLHSRIVGDSTVYTDVPIQQNGTDALRIENPSFLVAVNKRTGDFYQASRSYKMVGMTAEIIGGSIRLDGAEVWINNKRQDGVCSRWNSLHTQDFGQRREPDARASAALAAPKDSSRGLAQAQARAAGIAGALAISRGVGGIRPPGSPEAVALCEAAYHGMHGVPYNGGGDPILLDEIQASYRAAHLAVSGGSGTPLDRLAALSTGARLMSYAQRGITAASSGEALLMDAGNIRTAFDTAANGIATRPQGQAVGRQHSGADIPR